MTVDYEKDRLILSTGKVVYANNAILGINNDPRDGIAIHEGYDGGIRDDFTPDEKREIADYVIGLWMDWKGRL